MQNKDEALKNAPAYPLHPHAAFDMAGRNGLTKRELFAAMAMQGILSREYGDGFTPIGAAEDAVDYADALIKALNDESDQG